MNLREASIYKILLLKGEITNEIAILKNNFITKLLLIHVNIFVATKNCYKVLLFLILMDDLVVFCHHSGGAVSEKNLNLVTVGLCVLAYLVSKCWWNIANSNSVLTSSLWKSFPYIWFLVVANIWYFNVNFINGFQGKNMSPD